MHYVLKGNWNGKDNAISITFDINLPITLPHKILGMAEIDNFRSGYKLSLYNNEQQNKVTIGAYITNSLIEVGGYFILIGY